MGEPASKRKQRRSPERIAILGGGMAGLTAALELTRTRRLRKRYQVDVYQLGWRLGGKGASGRDVEGGTWRVEEHGLHFLFGWYENAFHLLREVYDELPDTWPWSFEDAFKPGLGPIVMYEHTRQGIEPWPMLWGLGFDNVRDNGYPGDGVEIPLTPEAAASALLFQLAPRLSRIFEAETRAHLPLVDQIAEAATQLPLDVDRTLIALRQGVRMVEELWNGRWRNDAAIRRELALAGFSKVVALGILQDLGSGGRTWFDLDGEDLREWLNRHHAPSFVVNAGFVNAIYDGTFARQAGFGAGTVLHALMCTLVRCKGALFYKMQAGMGDCIFAPIYQVLRARGVRFHFFHRVENLRLDEAGTAIDAIDIDRQARLEAPYEPLAENPKNGLPCWPNQPLWSQLEDGEKYRQQGIDFENWWETHQVGQRRLRRHRDFDQVVLGIGIGALKDICPELMAADPRFLDMVERVQTTQTMALQCWLNAELKHLGFDAGSPGPFAPDLADVPERPIGLSMDQPYFSWADMSQVSPQEDLPSTRSIFYACSSFPEPAPPPARVMLPIPIAASMRSGRSRELISTPWRRTFSPAPHRMDDSTKICWCR